MLILPNSAFIVPYSVVSLILWHTTSIRYMRDLATRCFSATFSNQLTTSMLLRFLFLYLSLREELNNSGLHFYNVFYKFFRATLSCIPLPWISAVIDILLSNLPQRCKCEFLHLLLC